MLKTPVLEAELLFAVTDQLTALPDTETEAHDTLDVAVGALHVLALGVTVITPDVAAAPVLKLVEFNV